MKALKVAKSLNIKVIGKTPIYPDNRGLSKEENKKYHVSGQWLKGRTITIDPTLADEYTVLHEIGHVLNGYMCCREHCEYAAHGSAIALARIYKINLGKDSKKRCDPYSGRSRECPAENLR